MIRAGSRFDAATVRPRATGRRDTQVPADLPYEMLVDFGGTFIYMTNQMAEGRGNPKASSFYGPRRSPGL